MLKLAFNFIYCLLLLLPFIKTTNLYCGKLDNLGHFIGSRDAVLVGDPKGHIIFSKNEDTQLIPASTLKIFTALVALHYLGPDYKFFTEFYVDRHSNLKIKGYGDPLLISEAVAEMIHNLSMKLDVKYSIINDLVLDDSYFTPRTKIPGVNVSYEPYDAPNGALCVNFNTVNFKRNKDGDYISAESQTPLLSFILSRIKSSQMNQGRIVLSSQRNEITRYAGHLFLYFLKKEGFRIKGNIRLGKIQKKTDKLIYRYVSSFSLIHTLSKLLEYSNNFIANQLLIAAGIKAYGPPGNLDKGLRIAFIYAKDILELDDSHVGFVTQNELFPPSDKNPQLLIDKNYSFQTVNDFVYTTPSGRSKELRINRDSGIQTVDEISGYIVWIESKRRDITAVYRKVSSLDPYRNFDWLFEQNNTGFMLIDKEGLIVKHNDIIKKYIREPGEWKGRNVLTFPFIHQHDLAPLISNGMKSSSKPQAKTYKLKSTGIFDTLEVKFSVLSLTDLEGSIVGAIMTVAFPED